MEAHSLRLRNFAEGRMLRIDPDLVEDPSLSAFSNGPGNQGDSLKFAKILLFQALASHARRDHGNRLGH